MIITKEIFEANVPSAKMPERNTSVHERLTHFFDLSECHLVSDIVSPALASLLDDEHGELLIPAQRFVCLDAFLRVIRSLDLVLTATGFGIVSTESTAPASKARVDALAEEVATQRLLTIERLVAELRSKEGWTVSPQAMSLIPSLFYQPSLLPQYCGLDITQANWNLARQRALIADAHLRRAMSAELFDVLLGKLRGAALAGDEVTLLNLCMKFYALFIPAEEPTPNSPRQSPVAQSAQARTILDDVISFVEEHADSFPVYVASRLYRARHADRYENQPTDPTFFFM